MSFQNHKSGDFSIISRDEVFLTKNGKNKQSLKMICLSDNALHILKNIIGVFRRKVAHLLVS